MMEETFRMNDQFHGVIEPLDDSKTQFKLSIYKEGSPEPLLETTLSEVELYKLVLDLSTLFPGVTLGRISYKPDTSVLVGKTGVVVAVGNAPAAALKHSHSSIRRFSLKGSDESELATVYIAIPQKEIDLFVVEQIQNACGDFMGVMGFKLKEEEEPVYGSFFQKILFKLKNSKTKEELNEVYTKGKEALETIYLDKPNAQVTQIYSDAASNLLKSIEPVDEACILIGELFVIKVVIDGRTIVIVRNRCRKLEAILQSNPVLLHNPRAMYELVETLGGDTSNQDYPVAPAEEVD